MTRSNRRFARQIDRIERTVPRMAALLRPGSVVRVPVAVLLILGGMMGFLPVLGFWMLPLGLLLLAIDLPMLRPLAASGAVRVRHWGRALRRRWRG